ncbi:hypothetical protein NMY22_g7640 [Coprinellus aureogranulatus]|nr:hypothetical protein NMY22_g7640 [Coprinellus aureogranulatus]
MLLPLIVLPKTFRVPSCSLTAETIGVVSPAQPERMKVYQVRFAPALTWVEESVRQERCYIGLVSEIVKPDDGPFTQAEDRRALCKKKSNGEVETGIVKGTEQEALEPLSLLQLTAAKTVHSTIGQYPRRRFPLAAISLVAGQTWDYQTRHDPLYALKHLNLETPHQSLVDPVEDDR